MFRNMGTYRQGSLVSSKDTVGVLVTLIVATARGAMFSAGTHVLKPLSGALLSLFTDVRVVDGSLETSRDALGVLVLCKQRVSLTRPVTTSRSTYQW